MQKLVVSPYRYSALLYASTALDYNTDVVVVFDDCNEITPVDWLCYEALAVQKRFETEKAYKQFGVRKLYYFGADGGDITEIERLTIQLQLLVSVGGITTLYYKDEDFCYDTNISTLYSVCSHLRNVNKRVIYSTDSAVLGRGGIFVNLDNEKMKKKRCAVEKMKSLEFFLRNCRSTDVEYFVEMGDNGGKEESKKA